MTVPYLDFRACNGLQPDTSAFASFGEETIQSYGYADAEPPDLIRLTNPLDEPVDIDVIDVAVLFRAAPPEIVQELFFRHYLTAEGLPLRMAEPCMDTGDTLFRGSSATEAVTEGARDVLDYLVHNFEPHCFRVTLAGGESVWIDNRRSMFRVTADGPIEVGSAYTTHVGDQFHAMQEDGDAVVR